MSEWKDLEDGFRCGGLAITGRELRGYRWREQGKLAIEFAAGAAVVAFYAWMLSRGADGPLIALALASCLFVGAYLAILVQNRRRVLRDVELPTLAWLEVMRRRVEADLSWNRFLGRSCAALAIFGLLWGPWQFFHFRAVYAAAPWRAVAGFGGYGLLLGGLWLVQRRKRRALLAQRASLDEE